MGTGLEYSEDKGENHYRSAAAMEEVGLCQDLLAGSGKLMDPINGVTDCHIQSPWDAFKACPARTQQGRMNRTLFCTLNF